MHRIRRPCRWLTAVVLLLVAHAGAARAQGVDVRLQLQPEHERQRARVMAAAERSVRECESWFGPPPTGRLLVVDRAWRSAPAPLPEPGVAVFDSRWLVTPASMLPEASIAKAISRQWWGVRVPIADAALAGALVDYSAGLIVERLFADRMHRPGYTRLELRFFDGFVPWAFRMPVLDRAGAARGGADRRLLTLERYLGWPALQRALAAVAARPSGGAPMSRDEFFAIAGDAVGQDLRWFPAAAFAPDGAIDYAIGDLTSVAASCQGHPCFRTTVVARRNGAPFPGSARAPIGEYESGRAIALAVTFADGTSASDTWDGRRETMRFEYESRVPAVSASLDPDAMLLLDRRRANNSRRLDSTAAGAAAQWSLRWIVWLEDALLAYASLA